MQVEDVASKLIDSIWTKNNICRIMVSKSTGDLYRYNDETKIWEWNLLKLTITEGINKFVENNIDSEELEEVLNGLYSKNYRNKLINSIKRLITQETTNKPFHIDEVSKDHYKEYNIFQGFTAKKVENYDSRLHRILHYIYTVLSNKNQETYDQIISWLANPLKTLTANKKWLILIGSDSGLLIFERFISLYVYGGSSEALEKVRSVHNSTLLATIQLENIDDIVYEDIGTSLLILSSNNPKSMDNIINIDTRCSRKCHQSYLKTLIDECVNQEVGNMFYSYLRMERI